MAQLSSQDRGCDGRQTRGREAGTCACLSPAARSYHEMTFSSSTTMETHKETWTKDRESRSQIPTLSLKKELKILFQNVTTFSSISSHHSNISNDFVPWRKEKHCLHVDLSWAWALALSLSDIFAGDSVLKGIEKKRRGKDRGKQRRKNFLQKVILYFSNWQGQTSKYWLFLWKYLCVFTCEFNLAR